MIVGALRKHKAEDGSTCGWRPPPGPKPSKPSTYKESRGAKSTRASDFIQQRHPPREPQERGASPPIPAKLLAEANTEFLSAIPLADVIAVTRRARVVDVLDHRLSTPLGDSWTAALCGTFDLLGTRNDINAWKLYFLLPTCTLRIPTSMRQTRAEWRRWDTRATERLHRWRRGEIAELWDELRAEVAPRQEDAPGDEGAAEVGAAASAGAEEVRRRRRVLRLVRLGRYSDAACALSAEPVAQLNAATLATLQEKLPAAPDGMVMPDALPAASDVPFTPDGLRKCIQSFPRGTGAGLSALPPDLLKLGLAAAVRAGQDEDFLRELGRLVQILCTGLAPQDVAPWLCGGRLTPVGAKVRPIVVSDTLARLCSKVMLSVDLDNETHDRLFKGIQGGVGEPGAIERTAFELKQDLQKHKQQVDHAILQVDFRNGFNSVVRGPVMDQLNAHTPRLGRWFRWAHLLPLSLVLADGSTLQAPMGTGQGDPASPAYFAMTLQPVLDHITREWGDNLGVHRAYLDDLVISGPVNVLMEIFDFLCRNQDVLARGLTVRPDKCCLYMPNQGVPDGLRAQYGIPVEVELVTSSGGITALGIPFGAEDFVQQVLGRVAQAIHDFGDSLASLENAQVELLLHTYSGGRTQAMHLYRCLPSAQACQEESGRLLQRLTSPSTEVTLAMNAQASLPQRMGGLGLINTSHVA
ncbi:MAG: reverse transcriptase domain-containing protein, partial [Roseimicrobium sp.]